MCHPKKSIVITRKLNVSVGATKLQNESKVSDAAKMAFKMQCIQFLGAVTGKTVERSPMKYKIVRAVTCLVPQRIVNNPSVCESRMAELVQVFLNAQRISANTDDKAKFQFSIFCRRATDDLKAHFKSYDSPRDWPLSIMKFWAMTSSQKSCGQLCKKCLYCRMEMQMLNLACQ
jgi:hypothetical protein